MTDSAPPRWVAETDPSSEDEAPEGDPDHDCTGEAADPDDGMDGVDLPEVEEDDDDGA